MSRTSINLDSTSYTNKDFNSVYPELLKLAKELSYKWDPTVSNESDPGVVLIKELALAVDKINYNTDKAALEQFPATVQQSTVARELFPLLGYYPKWYMSAEETISLVYTGTAVSGDYLIIPKFTMLQNYDGDLTYTIIKDVNLPMTTNGAATCQALEGTVSRMSINDSEIITEDFLDSDYRVYFRDYNIAQNGIFVFNESNLTNEWKLVDNMELEDVDSYCYQFGINPLTGDAYLQFPTWIYNIIGSGLSIWYVASHGTEGTASLGDISNFATTTIECQTQLGNTVSVTTENVLIANIGIVSYGKDPETIEEMYRGYKKTCGTFSTLVTRRDYENAIYLTGEVNNAKVCDRTNDIQQSYKIKKQSGVETKQSGTIVMQPYDLKVYGLLYQYPIETKFQYDYTFKMPETPYINPQSKFNPTQYAIKDIEEQSLMNIDFLDLTQSSYLNKMCLFTNKYNVKGQIYTSSALSTYQKQELTNIIQQALFDKYNSRQVNFGQEIDRDELLATIKSSDKRITSLYIEDLNFQTYVQYYDTNDDLKSVCISDQCDDYIKVSEVSGLSGNATFKVGDVTKSCSDYYAGQQLLAIETRNLTGGGTYYVGTIFEIKGDSGQKGDRLDLYTETISYKKEKFSVREFFRNEIIAKSILAGVTPYFNQSENLFNFLPGQGIPTYKNGSSESQLPSVQQVNYASTNKTYDISLDENGLSGRTFTIDKNNVIQFSKPTLTDLVTYGTYVKYEFVSAYRSRINAGEDYSLHNGEYISFVWSSEDEAETYQAVTYGEGSVISPTFNLSPTVYSVASSRIAKRAQGQELPFSSVVWPTEVDGLAQLSSSDSLVIKEVNQSILTNLDKIYFISEETTNDMYKLHIGADGQYILRNGEYIFYTNASKSMLKYAGAGTRLTASAEINLQFPIIPTINISLYGIQAFKDSDWRTIPDNSTLTISQQDFVNLTSGTSVTINLRMPIANGRLKFDSNSFQITGNNTYTPTFSTSLIKNEDGMTGNTYQGTPNFITDKYLDIIAAPHFESVTITAVKQSALNKWVFVNKNSQEVYLNDDYYGVVTLTQDGTTTTYHTHPYSKKDNFPSVEKAINGDYYFALDNRTLYKLNTSSTETDKYLLQEPTSISYMPKKYVEGMTVGKIYKITCAEEPPEGTDKQDKDSYEIITSVDAANEKYTFTQLIPGVSSVYYYFNFSLPEVDNTRIFTVGDAITFNYFKGSEAGTLQASVIKSIDYTRPTGETGSIVPGTTDMGWTIRGYLNLNCSASNPQELSTTESIIIKKSSDSTEEYVYTSTAEKTMIVESNLDLTLDGGTNINLRQLDKDTGEEVTPILRFYSVPYGYSSKTDLIGLFTVPSEEKAQMSVSYISKPTYFEPGEYIMKVTNTCSELKKASTKSIYLEYNRSDWDEKTWEKITYYSDSSQWDIGTPKGYTEQTTGVYTLGLVVPAQTGNQTVTYRIRTQMQKSRTDRSEVMESTGFLKVQKNPIIKNVKVEGGETGAEVCLTDQIIAELDSGKVYDYFTEITSDDLVENPVSSEAFFNTNHIYNDFVICQMNNYNLQIMR